MTKHNIGWLEDVKQELWDEFFSNQLIMQSLGKEIINADYHTASAYFLCFRLPTGQQHWFSKDIVTCLVDPEKNAYYYCPSLILRQKGL